MMMLDMADKGEATALGQGYKVYVWGLQPIEQAERG